MSHLPDFAFLPDWTIPALGLTWLLLATLLLVRPPRTVHPAVLQVVLAALLSGLIAPWLRSSGQWTDTSNKLILAAGILSLLVAVLPTHFIGRLAACTLAGLWMMLGAASLRHGTPLLPYMAAQFVLLGAAILLLPPEGRPRWRQAGVLLALVLAAMLGVHQDIPLPWGWTEGALPPQPPAGA